MKNIRNDDVSTQEFRSRTRCRFRSEILTSLLFDGLTDRMENRRENWAVGAHNRTIGCYFKESDGVGRTLTCQTRSDWSHPIIHFYHRAKWDK